MTFGRVLDEVIDLVGQVALDQHVAGEELPLGVDLAPAPHLDDVFGRHQDFLELVLEAALMRLLADRVGDFLLEVGIGVDDVPAHVHVIAVPLSGAAGRSFTHGQPPRPKPSARPTAARKHLVDDDEEQAREHDQQQHQSGGDQRLAPRRPDDLRGLGAHLLDEFKRVGHVLSVPFRTDRAAAPAAPSQKNSRRGASRRRATRASYRKTRPDAKRNMRFSIDGIPRAGPVLCVSPARAGDARS